MEDSFLMNNRDKPRRLSTLSTVSVSQESSLLGRLESGDKNTNYSSTDEEDEEKDASWKAQVSFQQDSDLSSPPLIVELIVSFGVFIMGWYLPKILFIPYLLGGIRERQIPYQTIPSTGDVILDLSLSHPYKEQVIINGKAFHFFWYFQGYLLSLILSGMLIFDSGTALHVIKFQNTPLHRLDTYHHELLDSYAHPFLLCLDLPTQTIPTKDASAGRYLHGSHVNWSVGVDDKNDKSLGRSSPSKLL